MGKIEKKEGEVMNCLNCGRELICGWSKESENFKAKLQWQNSNGKAHYKFSGGAYLCIDENGQIIPKEELPKNTQVGKTYTEKVNSTEPKMTSDDRYDSATIMLDKLWVYAKEKALKELPFLANTANPTLDDNLRDRRILQATFLHNMTLEYTRR